MKKLLLLMLGLVAIVVAVQATGQRKEAPKSLAGTSPEWRAQFEREDQREAQRKKEQELAFQRAVAIGRALKGSMYNPAAFQLEKAVAVKDGALCFEYRSTNGFGAVMPGKAVAIRDNRIVTHTERGFEEAWTRHCAGQSGESMISIRQVL